MADNPFSVDVVNPLQALMLGQQSYAQGVASNKQKAKEAAISDAGQMFGSNPQGAISKLLGGGYLAEAGNLANIQKGLAPETSAGIQEFREAQRAGFKGNILDFKKQVAEAGAARSTTNVNTGGGSDKQIFDALDESAKAARTAATGLQGIQEAKKAINAPGGIISGAGANQILGLQKIGAALGATDPSSIQNTETFRAAIAPQVAAMIKATVGTANISNSDREFAEKAAGGNITLDEGSIRRLLSIMERAGSATVKQHSDRLNAVYPDKKKFSREHALFGIPEGGNAPVRLPAGMTPAQAMKAFPPGTPIILPDGSEGVVPGG